MEWQASKLEIHFAQVVYVRCPFSGNLRRVSQEMVGGYRQQLLTPPSNTICYHMASLSASRKLHCEPLVISRKLVLQLLLTRIARNSPYPLARRQNMTVYLLPTSYSHHDPIYCC